MFLDGKSLHKYLVYVGVPQGPTLGATFSICKLMTFLMMLSVILLSMLMILISTLSFIKYLICGKDQSWPLNLNLTCGTLWTGARTDFNAGKTQLVLFDRSHNTGATDVKKPEFVLEEKSSFKMLWLTFSLLNWIGALTLSLLLKLPPRKLEP